MNSSCSNINKENIKNIIIQLKFKSVGHVKKGKFIYNRKNIKQNISKKL